MTSTAAHAAIQSFGYLHDPPPPATVVLDLRECLFDPHVDPALRALTGYDTAVRSAVLSTPGATGLIAHACLLATGLLQTGIDVTLAVGCAGGRHRSVVVAEDIAARLRLAGWSVDLRHRDVHRPVVQRSHDLTGEECS